MKQETIKMEETRKQPSNLEVIGAVITAGVLGFWFGIGTTLGSKVLQIRIILSSLKCWNNYEQTLFII